MCKRSLNLDLFGKYKSDLTISTLFGRHYLFIFLQWCNFYWFTQHFAKECEWKTSLIFSHLYLVVGFSRKTEGEVKYWTRGELTSKATLVLVRSKVNGSDVLLHHHNGKQHCSVARLLFIIAYRAYNKLLRHVNAPTFGVKMQSSSQCFSLFFSFDSF